MSASIINKDLSLVTLLLVTWSTGLVNAATAQDVPSASFYAGYGELALSWNHSLPIPNALSYSDVTTNVERYEQGLAIATAVTDASALLGDVGVIRTAVGTESIAAGVKALADSAGSAKSFFLLQNNTGRNLKVSFDWSAEWQTEAAIEDPGTDRTETELYLTLQKHEIRFNNVRTVVERIQRNIQDRRNRNDVFAKRVSARLPPEIDVYEHGNDGDSFIVNFGPRSTYLLVLSAEINGLSTVAVGGCAPSFWRTNRAWPIDRRMGFFETFGVGPRLRLDRALWLRHSLEDRFFSNAVAALLNATSPEIAYHIDDPDLVKDLVRDALLAGELEAVTSELEYHNTLGVPQLCD